MQRKFLPALLVFAVIAIAFSGLLLFVSISGYAVSAKQKAIVQIAGVDDLNDSQREFLGRIASQLGVQNIIIAPQDEKELEKVKKSYGISEKGVYFLGNSNYESSLNQPEIEKAALEFSLDMLHGTNSILILNAEWCVLAGKAIKLYIIKEMLPEFPQYGVVEFKSLNQNPDEFTYVDDILQERYALNITGLPMVFYFGKHDIIGGNVNAIAPTLTNNQTGMTNVFYNRDKIDFQSPPEDERYVLVSAILEQNKLQAGG